MSRLNTAKEKAIYDYVVAASGLAAGNVIWDKQDIASVRPERPAYPFATLNISAMSYIGAPEAAYKTTDKYEYTIRRAITISVNVFALSGWLDYVNKIAYGLELPTKQSILQAAGLAIHGHGQITDISSFLDTQHEGRGLVELSLSYGEVIEETTGEISEVDGTGTVGDVAVIINA